ncbi:hypothetical protein E2C01_076863 [Portunus trituberculatus]|uniref:Uncharacterized protein n=1 Tax=Portunus trituberculatus TaxID=210409 RepID=A0A5B7IPT7_PORTR|nr:hypothetical protein [Portunus trituberculatus]
MAGKKSVVKETRAKAMKDLNFSAKDSRTETHSTTTTATTTTATTTITAMDYLVARVTNLQEVEAEVEAWWIGALPPPSPPLPAQRSHTWTKETN